MLAAVVVQACARQLYGLTIRHVDSHRAAERLDQTYKLDEHGNGDPPDHMLVFRPIHVGVGGRVHVTRGVRFPPPPVFNPLSDKGLRARKKVCPVSAQ